MYHTLFIYALFMHLLMDAGYFLILVVVNNAAMNTGVCVSFQISAFIFFRHGIAGSYGSPFF